MGVWEHIVNVIKAIRKEDVNEEEIENLHVSNEDKKTVEELSRFSPEKLAKDFETRMKASKKAENEASKVKVNNSGSDNIKGKSHDNREDDELSL